MNKSLVKNFNHKIIILENYSNSELEREIWREKYSLYAEIISIGDNKFEIIEGLKFGHVMTEGYFIFKTRFTENITNKMRILFKNRLFEIKRITNIGERSKLMKILGLEIYVS